MAVTFSYKVMDKSGRMISGELEGENPTIVLTRLRQMGYVVIDLAAKMGSPDVGKAFKRFKKIKTKELTVFSRQFATMINSGLPLLSALTILGRQKENQRMAEMIEALRADVEAGCSLSEAMTKHNRVFSDLYIAMVQAGEHGGVLDQVLMRVATFLEKQQALKGKVKSAMSYPVLMLGFSMLMVGGMITFIVPIFANMFAGMGSDLPFPTKVLMFASDTIRHNLPIVILLVAAGTFAFKRWKRTEKGRETVDRVKLRLPLLGNIVRKTAIARFTRTFGTLVSSGVPIIQGLDIVANTAGNVIIKRAVEKARKSIREGKALAGPLEESGVFPGMVTQMISVGEETGTLDEMLSKIADFYDMEVETSVETLTSMIEPILIVVMGAMIGAIVLAMYLPMFTLINEIK